MITNSLVEINIGGYFAGYNAIIVCDNGNTCIINCFGKYSCVNTIIARADDALCTINSDFIYDGTTQIDCSFSNNYNDNSNRDQSCPIIVNTTTDINIDNIYSKYSNQIEIQYPKYPTTNNNNNNNYDLTYPLTSLASLQMYNESCVANDAYNLPRRCPDYVDVSDCDSTSFSNKQTVDGWYSVVCCTGQYSCGYSTFNIDVNNANGRNHKMFCNSLLGCGFATVNYSYTSSIPATAYAEIYCQGSGGCGQITVKDNYNYVELMQCSGHTSCSYMNVSNINLLICSGNVACYPPVYKNARHP